MKIFYTLIISFYLLLSDSVFARSACQISGSSVIFDESVNPNSSQCRVTPEVIEVNFYKIGVCNLSSAPVVSDISGANCSAIYDSAGSPSVTQISANNSTPITGGTLLPSPAPGTYNFIYIVIENKLRFKQAVSFVDNTGAHNPVTLVGVNPAHTGSTCWTTATQYTMPVPSTDFTFPLADCGSTPDTTYDFFTLAFPKFDCAAPNGTGTAYYCGPDDNDKPAYDFLALQNGSSIIQSSDASLPNRIVGFLETPTVITANPTTLSTIFTITNSVAVQFHYGSPNQVGYTGDGFTFNINVQ